MSILSRIRDRRNKKSTEGTSATGPSTPRKRTSVLLPPGVRPASRYMPHSSSPSRRPGPRRARTPPKRPLTERGVAVVKRARNAVRRGISKIFHRHPHAAAPSSAPNAAAAVPPISAPLAGVAAAATAGAVVVPPLAGFIVEKYRSGPCASLAESYQRCFEQHAQQASVACADIVEQFLKCKKTHSLA